MKAKASYFLATCMLFLALFFISQQKITTPTKRLPAPMDDIQERVANEDKARKKQGRKQWIQERHRAAPGVDWELMDLKTRFAKAQKRQKQSNQKTVETLANGNLTGEWREIGSNNQSGRIRYADVDVNNNLLYCLSQGGNVWKGDLNGNNWQVLNDYFRIPSPLMMHLLDQNSGGKRLLVGSSGWSIEGIYFSDDEGQSWNQTTGLSDVAFYGYIRQVAVANDADQTVYVLARGWDMANWTSVVQLYRSTNLGTSFSKVTEFNESTYGSVEHFSIWTAYDGSGNVYLLNDNNIYLVDNATGMPNLISTFTVSNTRDQILLTGAESNGTTYLYALYNGSGQSDIYRSTDGGNTWNSQGNVGEYPFSVYSFACSQADPDKIYLGGLDVYRSYNGGSSWSIVNSWGEYYGSPATKLHADIPAIQVFNDASGNEFDLISTDGGIYKSTNNILSVSNLSLDGLRVSQYYTSYTKRDNYNILYTGSQDQGYQRTLGAGNNLVNFTQVLSGDYAQMVSGDGGSTLWTAYPGFVMYVGNATASSILNYWDFVGNGYLWIPPLMEDPNAPASVYVGGGNETGGAHIFRLTRSGGSISYVEEAYDFWPESGSTRIGAMGYSKIDDNYRYVMMENGHFFHSTDGGANWTYTTAFDGPDGFYLFGTTLVPSPTELGTVYIGGSGYSNPAAYRSTNHGQTFTPINNGLPNTLINKMDINDDGTLLFAATDVGPYVYVVAENQWYPMDGVSAPDQVYWDVDFVNSSNLVRFSSDGRGVWEFAIQPAVTPTATAKIKVLLEGCYDTSTNLMNTNLLTSNNLPLTQPYDIAPWNYTGTESINTAADFPADVVDWVLVEARDANYDIVATRAAFLRNDGEVLELDGSEGVQFPSLLFNADYHLTVRHRNHLAVVSSNMSTLSNASSYDFTAANSTLGGNPQQKALLNGSYALYAGDYNADGILSVNDYNGYASQLATAIPYEDADFNLDGNVTIGDFNLYQPHSSVIGVRMIRY